jgi:hypothetical protein
MFVGFELDAAAWATSVRALGDALDTNLKVAVGEIAQDVAFAARADHPYTDQSGTLTRRTRAYAPRGRFSHDTLRDEVIADTDYADYVMRRRGDWLEEAFRRTEGRIEHRLHDALEASVRHAGLAG